MSGPGFFYFCRNLPCGALQNESISGWLSRRRKKTLDIYPGGVYNGDEKEETLWTV